jgi:hypothetical protein
MTAILPESRIQPIVAGWSWQYGPVLNSPKYILSIRIRPLDLGDHMLSQKLLVDVDIDMFAGETICGLNPQGLPLIQLTSLSFASSL